MSVIEITMQQREQPNTEARMSKAEAETLARMCQAIGHLSTIAEDCDGWLNNQCDETACEFIKAVRDYARKAVAA
jgi:hypothetical protein